MPIKQRLLSLFVLFVFIGQSVAAVHASCSSMDTGDGSALMLPMDHAMHGMQDNETRSGSDRVCCGDTDCSMLQCGSLVAAIVNCSICPSTAFPAGSVIKSDIGLPFSLATSLFRPPISS
jgi:hypothetical protein